MTMTLTSAAFGRDERIPVQYTGEGEDRSPPLRWTEVPPDTRELALICDDPDAPTPQPWVHWLIYGMAADVRELVAGIPTAAIVSAPVQANQGKNSWPDGATVGYRGPLPPVGHGVHHYHFRLYALNARLHLAPGADKPQLLAAMSNRIIANAELIGTYSR